MVVIESMEKLRGNVILCLDNGQKIYLTGKEAAEGGFCHGMALPEEALNHFVQLHQYPRPLNLAVGMLARRPCSRGEIQKKLQLKHFSDEVTELVLYKLEREKLLNDEDFARQWVQYRSSGKYGARRIYQELRQKGVDEETAEMALQSLSGESSLETAVQLAAKGLQRKKPDEPRYKARNRIIAGLLRKGYDWETAAKAFEKAEQHEDE